MTDAKPRPGTSPLSLAIGGFAQRAKMSAAEIDMALAEVCRDWLQQHVGPTPDSTAWQEVANAIAERGREAQRAAMGSVCLYDANYQPTHDYVTARMRGDAPKE